MGANEHNRPDSVVGSCPFSYILAILREARIEEACLVDAGHSYRVASPHATRLLSPPTSSPLPRCRTAPLLPRRPPQGEGTCCRRTDSLMADRVIPSQEPRHTWPLMAPKGLTLQQPQGGGTCCRHLRPVLHRLQAAAIALATIRLVVRCPDLAPRPAHP